jgi:hypothetical protein
MGRPGNPDWNTEVQNKLIATGLFTTVDAYDLGITPTLEQMQSYDAILVYTDGGISNPVTFGDDLANYVDSGGGVVAAVFATASLPVQGRFDTDNYWAIQPTGSQNGHETLGTIFVPDHPILNGVTSFDGGSKSYRPSADSLHPTATRIANWTGSGNIALIATRVINGVRRADLGFYPPSNDSRSDLWINTTDGAKIMANALLWVAGKAVGTIGTRFVIAGSGFGNSKPTVYLQNGNKKVLAKVETWSDSSITCLWTKKLPAGSYPLFVQPKGKGVSPVAAGNFTIMQPSIDEITPDDGAAGDVITVNGWYFTNKKPKVYFEDPDTHKRKSCKVLSSSMDPETGSSTLQFVIPKWGLDSYNLILINVIGQTAAEFPVDASLYVDALN